MASPILLCCDLDRTLIPNGPQPESPGARPLLRALAHHPGLRPSRPTKVLHLSQTAFRVVAPRQGLGAETAEDITVESR